MRGWNIAFILALLVSVWGSRALADQDLRVQYGTRSLEVARHIDAAIKLSNSKHPEDALKEITPAVKDDPTCAMAWLWQGTIDSDLGDIDSALDGYKHCVALDTEPSNREVTTTAKTNMGLLLGQVKRFDEAAYWFSRAIVDDSDDHAKEQAKAYRNLALTLHFENQDFAASLAAITGHEIDPQRVEESMIDGFLKAGVGQEGARVLCLEQDLPKLTARTEPSSLKEIKLTTVITENVIRLLSDPHGQYVLAIVAGDHYYIIEIHPAGDPTVRKVPVTGSIVTACLAGGKLYAIVGSKLLQFDPLTGKSDRTWDLGDAAPKSVAVLPSKNAAFFTAKDEIKWLNLIDGKISDTDLPGQVVTADPTEKYLYARYKDEEAAVNHNMVVIDGHPVFVQADHFDWEQTTLFKYYIAPRTLLPAAIRLNSAANGYDVVVSPDGQWVACPGGGGWRPDNGKAGYNIPVFVAGDFNKVQKCFINEGNPTGCAFNPVTQEFVGIHGAGARLYHLATDNPDKPAVKIAAECSGQAAWSGDGRYLVLGLKGPGVRIFQDVLTPDETKLALTWWQKITPVESVASRAASRPAPQRIDALAQFQPTTDRAALQKSLAAAIASKATDQALDWQKYSPYTANPDSLAAITDAQNAGAEPGVRIYTLNQALAKDTQNIAIKSFTAEAMAQGGQPAGAKTRYLDVIHADAGRTNLTLLSLEHLAAILSKDSQDISAADCLAHALALDRANPRTIELLTPLLEKLKFTSEATALSHDAVAAGPSDNPIAKIPALPPAPAGAIALPPAKLFQNSAPSVVLIHCGDGAGTGVCVGLGGIVLTSLHVVAHGDVIEVFPFTIENGKARRMASLSADIIARSEKDDLAILQVANPPAAMKPLPVADKSPAVGDKVYALGNPGLGNDTLDLSFSEGIVSSVDRNIRGNSYLQHTAAVNPGNSGGPLLSDSGLIVGVVCLKADLSGVSFATPVKTIRAMFPQNPPEEHPK